jgi:predicted trehalose synthase
VASTDPSEFVPIRQAQDRQERPRAPALLDALDLDRGRWLLLLETASGVLASAVVEDHDGFRRARAGDGVADELLARAATDDVQGGFTFRRLGAIGPWGGGTPIEVDQSNESIVVGGKAVVKRLVWTAPGNERPMVLPAHLVAAGFDEMPAPLGNASWQNDVGAVPLVSIDAYLPDARDGWDWYVELFERSLDLDGDPLGSGTIEGSPAKDVASLVQSLDHVGRVAERRRGGSVAAWIREASDACLEAYRGELGAIGASALFDERLMRPLRVAQELHEFVYAARYLLSWRYVPDRALAAIMGGDS